MVVAKELRRIWNIIHMNWILQYSTIKTLYLYEINWDLMRLNKNYCDEINAKIIIRRKQKIII